MQKKFEKQNWLVKFQQQKRNKQRENSIKKYQVSIRKGGNMFIMKEKGENGRKN